MKKILVGMLAISAVACALLGLAACADNGTHTVTHHAAKAASCEADGNVEYWYCEDCDEYYTDQDLKKEVSYFDVILPMLGHDLKDVAAVAPTCIETGNTAGQECSRCDYYTAQSVKALGHDMTHHDEAPAGCTKSGTREHWSCSREEGVYYADEDGSAKLSSIFLVATGHKMTHVEAFSSCTEFGWVEHWVCANEPDVYYLDEGATETIEDIAVSPIGHDWADVLTHDQTHHWYECNNDCGELGDYEEHVWDGGDIIEEATTSSQGRIVYTCEGCGREREQILPRLGTFSFNVSEIDLYNNEDGGTVDVDWDLDKEGDFYVEGTVITVTVTANIADGFAIGAIRKNGELLVDSPLCKDGVYAYSFAIKENTELTVEFGKPVTTSRAWNLRDGSGKNFAYPWEYYTQDAAENGNGTAVLLVYDVTGIDDVRTHDFSADEVFLSYDLYQTLSWDTVDAQVWNAWLDLARQLKEEELEFNFTLAFAIRLFPSEAKRLSGYVGSELILPTAITVGGVDYDMTNDYGYSKDDLTAPSDAQFSINEQGTAFEFFKSAAVRGSVFTTYHAAYIEIEMKNGDEVYYAYLFAENGILNMYSSLDKSGTPLSCSSVNNAWIYTSAFDSWALQEYSDVTITATGWEFRTKVHVDENSSWLFNSDWSDVIKYNAQ